MQRSWRENYLRYKSFLLNTVDRYEERTDVRIYLEILLSLITISVFSVFALRPTLLTIAELIKEIEAKEELVNKLDNKIETITTAQILYDKQRSNIQLLKRSIPSNPKTDSLIYQLEGLVEKNGLMAQKLTINEIPLLKTKTVQKPQDPNKKADSTFIDFDVQISGDYTLLLSFMADVEKLLRPIKISNTSIISQQDDETGDITLKLILSGEIPYTYNTNNSDQDSIGTQ